MADISSYTNKSPVTGSDKWIGTDASGNTRNFTAEDVTAYINGTAPGTVTTVAGPAHTLVLTDANIVMSGSSASSVTVPLNSVVPFPIGTTMSVMNKLSTVNSVTIGVSTGATLTYASTNNVITQNNARTLKKIAVDAWFLY